MIPGDQNPRRGRYYPSIRSGSCYCAPMICGLAPSVVLRTFLRRIGAGISRAPDDSVSLRSFICESPGRLPGFIHGGGSIKSRLVLGTALFSVLVSVVPASAVERDQAIENCRKTVGKPIVTACMRSGGSIEACRGSAKPQVQACVRSATGGGQRGMRGCNSRQKLSGEPCL
jgi:hypothetical protein